MPKGSILKRLFLRDLSMSLSGRKGYFLVRVQGWKKFLPADWSATPCKCSRLSKFGLV